MNKFVSPSRRLFNVINFVILVGTGILCLVPFVNLLAISFSSSAPVSAGKVTFWPVDFTLAAYQFTVEGGKFFPALLVSIKRCVLGVMVNLILMICCAYPLSKSKNQFKARNFFMVYFVITMIIGGGLIPTFIVVMKMNLLDSIWSLVLPGAVPVGTMVILMNFIRQMPADIEEAAMIDGAGVFRRLVNVMLPLLKPALATVGLFCLVGHWNDWFSGMIYMQMPKNYPLQTYLQSVLRSINELLRIFAQSGGAGVDYQSLVAMMNARTGRAAQLFLGMVPMMLVYPFLQKYFTKGVVIGSIKG
jgi:putative aldouronate transport system permease protein